MKIYWSGDSKYNRRKSPRAAIGKEMVAARFGDKSAAARLRMLRPHHPPHRKRRPLRPRLRSQSPRQGLQRFLRIPIRRLKRSLRERFHYFIHGKRQQCRIPQAVCRRATVTRASRSKARLRAVTIRRRLMAKPCTPHPIPQAAQLFKLQSANAKFLSGD